MRLTDDTTFFQSATGEVIAYGDKYSTPLLYSPNGITFYELYKKGYGGTFEDHEQSFENPHNGTSGRFHRVKDELELDGKKYRKVDSRLEVEVVPLPTIRRPEYLFALPDGQYLYVSADLYKFSYESFKLFVGPRNSMRQVPIEDVMRARDGGTTYVKTAEGTLFSPTPFDKDKKATWKDEIELTKVDPKQFTIVENSNVELQAA